MPFKDPSKRRKYAKRCYSSSDQKAKKRRYDSKRYQAKKSELDDLHRRVLYPHRYVYNGEWICSLCGADIDLVVHHSDFNHYNNEPNNLMCLCRSCHAKLHSKAANRNSKGQFTIQTN